MGVVSSTSTVEDIENKNRCPGEEEILPPDCNMEILSEFPACGPALPTVDLPAPVTAYTSSLKSLCVLFFLILSLRVTLSLCLSIYLSITYLCICVSIIIISYCFLS